MSQYLPDFNFDLSEASGTIKEKKAKVKQFTDDRLKPICAMIGKNVLLKWKIYNTILEMEDNKENIQLVEQTVKKLFDTYVKERDECIGDKSQCILTKDKCVNDLNMCIKECEEKNKQLQLYQDLIPINVTPEDDSEKPQPSYRLIPYETQNVQENEIYLFYIENGKKTVLRFSTNPSFTGKPISDFMDRYKKESVVFSRTLYIAELINTKWKETQHKKDLLSKVINHLMLGEFLQYSKLLENNYDNRSHFKNDVFQCLQYLEEDDKKLLKAVKYVPTLDYFLCYDDEKQVIYHINPMKFINSQFEDTELSEDDMTKHYTVYEIKQQIPGEKAQIPEEKQKVEKAKRKYTDVEYAEMRLYTNFPKRVVTFEVNYFAYVQNQMVWYYYNIKKRKFNVDLIDTIKKYHFSSILPDLLENFENLKNAIYFEKFMKYINSQRIDADEYNNDVNKMVKLNHAVIEVKSKGYINMDSLIGLYVHKDITTSEIKIYAFYSKRIKKVVDKNIEDIKKIDYVIFNPDKMMVFYDREIGRLEDIDFLDFIKDFGTNYMRVTAENMFKYFRFFLFEKFTRTIQLKFFDKLTGKQGTSSVESELLNYIEAFESLKKSIEIEEINIDKYKNWCIIFMSLKDDLIKDIADEYFKSNTKIIQKFYNIFSAYNGNNYLRDIDMVLDLHMIEDLITTMKHEYQDITGQSKGSKKKGQEEEEEEEEEEEGEE